MAEELQALHTKNKELLEIVKKAQDNANNISGKMESVKKWINEVITWEVKKIKEYINDKMQADSKIITYKWIVSTEREIEYKLDPILPKLQAPYRMEVVAIRYSKPNENTEIVQLPGIENFEWKIEPIIYVKSKWGKAIYEYDFDVLVTKL